MSDRIADFETHVKAVAATLERVASTPTAVCAAVEKAAGAGARIVLGSDEFLPAEIWKGLRELPGVIAQPSDEQLSTADAGISGAFAGVASSGSVCIAMGPPLAAAASLLMPLHVVLVSPERIVERPRDLFDPGCLGGEALRRDIVFITGPSATADMGPLVRGVHGPHRLHILLLG